MKTVVSFFLVVVSCFCNANAQDVNFSQFYASSVYLNPALAGLEKDLYLGVNYRNDQRDFHTTTQSTQANVILPLYNKKTTFKNHLGSIGLSLLNQSTGSTSKFTSTAVLISTSSKLLLNKTATHQLAFGMQGGILQRQYKIDDFNWGSQYVPSIGFDQSIAPSINFIQAKTTIPLFHTGLFWLYDSNPDDYKTEFSAYLGIALSNLNRPNESLFEEGTPVRMPIKWKHHGGINFSIADYQLILSPNFLLQYQDRLSQLDLGCYASVQLRDEVLNMDSPGILLSLGAWHRIKDAYIISAGLQWDNFTFGVSYDANISSLKYYSNGNTFEFSLSYKLRKGKPIKFSTPFL
ncbi:PorP/SprF family type IX secretion system membrane protein [Rapidithrix thailandica]|uniref:PorP/SprF family type IX secretion system membrane protein n=1 Tax=Rapidithrix thailandica TaxID=413964 RepID=A0AAW9SEM5_9BACT